MTRKLFWDNPYLTQIRTTITDIVGPDVQVAETILYAFSGGQESDTGTIGQRQVLQARKDDKTIIYTLTHTDGLGIGDPVTMQIDWVRRYQLMRLHFAAEIILELMYKHCAQITKIGAHIAQEKARIDFLWPENLSSALPIIQSAARELVEANKNILSAFSDVALERRYWQIEGFARVNCGGTHLKRTGEVGVIELKRKNVGKGKERIEISVD